MYTHDVAVKVSKEPRGVDGTDASVRFRKGTTPAIRANDAAGVEDGVSRSRVGERGKRWKNKLLASGRGTIPVTPATALRGSPGHADTRVDACRSVKALCSKTLPRKAGIERVSGAPKYIFAIESHAEPRGNRMTQFHRRVARSGKCLLDQESCLR